MRVTRRKGHIRIFTRYAIGEMQISFAGEAHTLPPAAVIGVVGTGDSGVRKLLRAAGSATVVEYALDAQDAVARAASESDIEQARRTGRSVLLASHDLPLLRRLTDEIWWVRDGRVERKGDPHEVIQAYEQYVAGQIRQAARTRTSPLAPAARRGDGRAELIELATLDASGKPTSGWNSGEEAIVRVRVKFHAAVPDPVVGIMIRTRIGMEVYGTNTELERVVVGPCAAGDVRTVDFRFACNLCPQIYTITAASHDPDGVWHDWMEDALAFTVSDTRYTAGVANVRARVTCCRE